MVLRNDQTVMQLKSEFQATDDASFAHESLVSSYLALPGLRGFWPMSAIGASGEAIDVGGAGRHLTNENTVRLLAWPQPAAFFVTANSESFYTADASAFDIIGNETYVHAGFQGLTIGAWVYFDAIGQTHGLMGKYTTAAGNRSYLLQVTAADKAAMTVSVDGTNLIFVTHTTSVAIDKWYFIVGRYDPSTEVKVWLNDVAVIQTTSVPATIFNGNADFTIGCYGAAAAHTAYMEGKVSCAFLCAAMIPDHTIRRLYYRTRPAFQSRENW